MPTIPYRMNAVIDPAKLRYLLTSGKKHTAYFVRFGVTEKDADWLETELMKMVHNSEYVGEPMDNGYEMQYSLSLHRRASECRLYRAGLYLMANASRDS